MTPRNRSFSALCLLSAATLAGQALVAQTPVLPTQTRLDAASRQSAIGDRRATPGHRQPTAAAPVVAHAGQATAAAPAPATPAAAGQPSDDRFRLTVDGIMEGPRLVGYPPTDLRWSGDSQRLYFEWRPRDADEPATFVVPRAGGEPRKLTDEERKSAPPTAGKWDAAHARVLAVQAGDIVLLDTVAQTRRALTRTVAGEANPRWARGEKAITFTRDNSLFLLSLTGDGDGLVQLTDAGPKKVEPKLTDSQKFVKAEEEKLLAVVKEDAEKKKKAEEKKKRDELPRLDLTERQSVFDLALAHDDAYAYALVVERAQGAKRADVPTYVTESGYTEELPARTKVGDTQDSRRLAIINLKTKQTVWASLDVPGAAPSKPETTEPKPGAEAAAMDADAAAADPGDDAPDAAPQRAAGGAGASAAVAAASGEQGKAEGDKKPAARELRWGMPSISPDGKVAVAVARAADNKDRWIVAIDPETGKTRVLDHLHDDAWIREGQSTGWLADNQQYYYLAERDGWMHLYSVDAANKGIVPARQLTSGKWEIDSVDLSPDKKSFYITSTEAHPGERQVYVMPVQGGARTKLTGEVGAWTPEVSPDGQMLATIHSTATRPPEVFIQPNQPGATPVKVTNSPSAAWLTYKWVAPQLVTFAARDGAQVYARLYTPEMVGAKRHASAPGVVFVHGAGYLQNAHKYWSSYFREYMFHHLLASRGYVVLDVDYRASAGYGRDWRTAVYRHMGGKDLEDIVDGAGYLAKTQKVNPRRVGVYGGSYGGFITLMAMFTTPDAFAAGAALRPVTDWAHYNHPYTSNILNEPQDDAEAYRRSSPIYFAEGLKGALLICHGMVDVNVHFQDSVRLAQRLIELRKENWELAPYPVEDHGFDKATSWADEYKRILKLFEDNLKTRS